MRLRAEGRRLRKVLEGLEGAEPPKSDAPPDIKKLQQENIILRRELESSGKRLAEACWPGDHEKKDLPEDIKELQALVSKDIEKWESARSGADRLRDSIRAAYNEVISKGRANKESHVFQMGVALDDFLKEWFP